MSKNIVLDKKQQFLAVFLSVVLSLLVVWAAASGATTISTNISTGGTLTVSDTSTLTGLVTETGGFISVASSTVVGKFQVNGALNASSSIYVLGDARFDGGVGIGAANSVAKTLLISALTSDPTDSEGRIYYNSVSKLLKFYDGTQWALIASSTAGAGLVSSGDRIQLSSFAEGYMTIGTTTNRLQSSMLTLQGTSTASIPLTIYATSGQTTNLLQLMSEKTDVELFVIDALGNASGTAMSLSGSLIVTASSTFNSTLDVSGNLSTKGTLAVTDTSAFTGKTTHTAGAILVASSSAVSNFHVLGVLNASSTITANSHIIASSTGTTLVGIGVGTSTPSTEISVVSSATTTLSLDSTGAGNKGGCLQLRGTDGNWYRAYASTTGPLYLSSGTCK